MTAGDVVWNAGFWLWQKIVAYMTEWEPDDYEPVEALEVET